MDTDLLHRTIYFAWEAVRAELRGKDMEEALWDYLHEWFIAGLKPKTTVEMELCLNYATDYSPRQYDAMIEHYWRERGGH